MGDLRARFVIGGERRPLAIAWILYGSLDQRTGGTIYDAEIIRGLRRRGDSVEVLSISVPHRGASSTSATRLLRQLALLRPDIVVGDELCFRELAFVFPRASFTRRLLLVHHLTCWELELKRSQRLRARRPEAIALRHADAVITTSKATRARLIREGHRSPIDVVLPGSDRLPRNAGAADRGEAPLRFLFVGAIMPRKRVKELVKAFASITTPATLRLVGSREAEPRYAAEVARTIEALGVHDRVTFAGEIDESELSRELAAADVIVMPSSLEGYGIAATEAVCAGTPVIAARTAGLEEALAPCPHAVLFVDEASLAATLHDFATNEELRAAMRAGAHATKLPTWSEASDRFRSHIEDAATSPLALAHMRQRM